MQPPKATRVFGLRWEALRRDTALERRHTAHPMHELLFAAVQELPKSPISLRIRRHADFFVRGHISRRHSKAQFAACALKRLALVAMAASVEPIIALWIFSDDSAGRVHGVEILTAHLPALRLGTLRFPV